MCKTRYTYQNPFTKVYSIHVVCIIRLDLSQIVNHDKIKMTTKKKEKRIRWFSGRPKAYNGYQIYI